MSAYAAIKFFHILFAIVAAGFNMSYAIWLARAAQEPDHLSHVLRGIRFLDDRFANPGYGLLLLSGLAMVVVGHIPLTTFWIAAALVLWLILAVGGFGVYTPTLRRQIQVLESAGPTSPEFQQLSSRGRVVGIALAVVVILILVMMVFKPHF